MVEPSRARRLGTRPTRGPLPAPHALVDPARRVPEGPTGILEVAYDPLRLPRRPGRRDPAGPGLRRGHDRAGAFARAEGEDKNRPGDAAARGRHLPRVP